LSGVESNIYPDYLEKNKVIFYCYSKGRKLIESVKIDFTNSSVERKSFYVQKGIAGIKAEHKDNNESKLYVVQLENEKLSLSVYNSILVNYLNSYYTISDNVINVSTGKKNSQAFYFWQNRGDSLTLYYVSFSNNFENPETKYSVKIKKDYNILSLTGDFFPYNKDALFTLIHTPELNLAVTLFHNIASKLGNKENIEELASSDIESFYVAAYNFKGSDKIFYYLGNEKKLKKIDFINNGKDINISSIADEQNVGDYFIKNMNMRNFHFVFTNKKENCITIKQLQ
jgi:hypothetical protein